MPVIITNELLHTKNQLYLGNNQIQETTDNTKNHNAKSVSLPNNFQRQY